MEGSPYNTLLDQIDRLIDASGLRQNMAKFAQLIRDSIHHDQSIQPLKLTQDYERLKRCFQRFEPTLIEQPVKRILPLPKNSIRYSYRRAPEGMSLLVVLLPKGAELQLHNHPKMIVFTKPLWGLLQVESMDLAQNTSQPPHPPNKQHATNNWRTVVIDNKDISIATPEHANIHRLQAASDCLLLDVLMPEYQVDPSYYRYVSSQHDLEETGPLQSSLEMVSLD